MLSALHLYLDEEWLHPIFCLIHPLNSVQPQPLLEMRVMMMMIASVSLSSVQCCNILTSKARMAYNNNQLKPDHRRWHEMHQPFEIHLSPSLKTTSINIRVFKCNIDSFFAPETYNTNALMMKSMNPYVYHFNLYSALMNCSINIQYSCIHHTVLLSVGNKRNWNIVFSD